MLVTIASGCAGTAPGPSWPAPAPASRYLVAISTERRSFEDVPEVYLPDREQLAAVVPLDHFWEFVALSDEIEAARQRGVDPSAIERIEERTDRLREGTIMDDHAWHYRRLRQELAALQPRTSPSR
jgi:hypothetical protein